MPFVLPDGRGFRQSMAFLADENVLIAPSSVIGPSTENKPGHSRRRLGRTVRSAGRGTWAYLLRLSGARGHVAPMRPK